MAISLLPNQQAEKAAMKTKDKIPKPGADPKSPQPQNQNPEQIKARTAPNPTRLQTQSADVDDASRANTDIVPNLNTISVLRLGNLGMLSTLQRGTRGTLVAWELYGWAVLFGWTF